MQTSRQNLRGPVALVHCLLRQLIRYGSKCVDATCGNGNDTLLMAELVGTSGHVWAMDIQESAVNKTRALMQTHGFIQHTTVIHSSHEQIAEHCRSGLDAVVFNLGWLPGGDKRIVTRPETTITALNQSLSLLAPSGLLIVTCYPGHEGGDKETAAVVAWAASLPPGNFHCWQMAQLNVLNGAPFCLVIQKSGAQDAS